MRHGFRWPLALFALLVSGAGGAQVLKCTDAQGNVTYSDLPCLRSEKATVVDTRAASSVIDHSFIRAHKARLTAPVPAPAVPDAPPVAPASAPTELRASSPVLSPRTYGRY